MSNETTHAPSYDFSEVKSYCDNWIDIPTVSAKLKDTALRLAVLNDSSTGIVTELQLAVISACEILDRIKTTANE